MHASQFAIVLILGWNAKGVHHADRIRRYPAIDTPIGVDVAWAEFCAGHLAAELVVGFYTCNRRTPGSDQDRR
jgi:hypothetical protein